MDERPTKKLIVILMGASGAGKSSLGQSLSRNLEIPFLEGDDFHSEHNKQLMASGLALTDDDRWPWLDALGTALSTAANQSGGAICSCSALRYAYRKRLRSVMQHDPLFLFLDADRDVLQRRMMARANHYMPTSLLESQLALLEPPEGDEWHVTLCANQNRNQLAASAEQVLREVMKTLFATQPPPTVEEPQHDGHQT